MTMEFLDKIPLICFCFIFKDFLFTEPCSLILAQCNCNCFHFIFHLAGSIGASMPNFSFLEGVILTLSVGWWWWEWCGELHNKA